MEPIDNRSNFATITMDSQRVLRDHSFAVGASLLMHWQPGVETRLESPDAAGYPSGIRGSPPYGGRPGGLRPGRVLSSGFRPWLARHLRRQKRRWHLPPRASAGGWIIGSSKNDPPAGRLHYSSGEPGRPAGSRGLIGPSARFVPAIPWRRWSPDESPTSIRRFHRSTLPWCVDARPCRRNELCPPV